MKKVNETKQPTIRQLISMSENLREKFNKFSSIQMLVNTHSGRANVEYWVYVEDTVVKSILSWRNLLSFYGGLMKGDDNG